MCAPVFEVESEARLLLIISPRLCLFYFAVMPSEVLGEFPGVKRLRNVEYFVVVFFRLSDTSITNDHAPFGDNAFSLVWSADTHVLRQLFYA